VSAFYRADNSALFELILIASFSEVPSQSHLAVPNAWEAIVTILGEVVHTPQLPKSDGLPLQARQSYRKWKGLHDKAGILLEDLEGYTSDITILDHIIDETRALLQLYLSVLVSHHGDMTQNDSLDQLITACSCAILNVTHIRAAAQGNQYLFCCRCDMSWSHKPIESGTLAPWISAMKIREVLEKFQNRLQQESRPL
jgi:hypothetical protein